MNHPPLEVGFVGAGNMGQALIAGLIRGGMPASGLGIAEPDDRRAAALRQAFPGLVRRPAARLATEAKTLVFAVKPQVFAELVPTLAEGVTRSQPLIVSVAAGISTQRLATWLGPATRIIRAMPNTPALIGAGIAGLYANAQATPTDRDTAQALLGAVGDTIWVPDETQMHAVTATSGSGPAYVFLLIEAMTAAATELGLDARTAARLTVATVSGAARLAAEGTEDPSELRRRVTSPGGTTERALEVLAHGGLVEQIKAAMQAAATRSRELGE